MKFLFLAIALVLTPALATGAEICDVPVSDWQPVKVLKSKLEDIGWRVKSIVAQDGCYRAMAVDKSGYTVSATFNPKTLEPVENPAPVHEG